MSIFGDLFGDEEITYASPIGPVNRPSVGSVPHPLRPSNRLCGIYNQGATCYMNSLLQTLLYTPEFRGKYKDGNFLCQEPCAYYY